MDSFKIEQTDAAAIETPFLLGRLEHLERDNFTGTKNFVAWADGAEAGLLVFDHWPTHPIGIVREINVLMEFRSNGVGSRLLSHAHTVALDSGCKILRLQARSLDQEHIADDYLLSWYGRKGFVRDSADSCWMQKILKAHR